MNCVRWGIKISYRSKKKKYIYIFNVRIIPINLFKNYKQITLLHRITLHIWKYKQIFINKTNCTISWKEFEIITKNCYFGFPNRVWTLLKRNTWKWACARVVTCGRVDRDGRAVIGGAVLPTTSGPRIRSCKHLPFAGKQHALPQQCKTKDARPVFLCLLWNPPSSLEQRRRVQEILFHHFRSRQRFSSFRAFFSFFFFFDKILTILFQS